MPIASKIFTAVFSLLALSGAFNFVAADELAEKRSGGLRVAVASNFLPTLRELVFVYQAETGDQIKIIAASTGKLYAQIIHGAPFDILLSADSRRPQLLEQNGYAVESSRFTYALGKIALWSSQQNSIDCRNMLENGRFKRLAIANPKTAPYGVAAQQLLEQLGLWGELQPKLVRGENIAQTLHYVASGNAQLGVIALSLVKLQPEKAGCIWEVPTKFYQPIEQQAVLLKRAASVAAAERFLSFLKSEKAAEMIRSSGYGIN